MMPGMGTISVRMKLTIRKSWLFELDDEDTYSMTNVSYAVIEDDAVEDIKVEEPELQQQSEEPAEYPVESAATATDFSHSGEQVERTMPPADEEIDGQIIPAQT